MLEKINLQSPICRGYCCFLKHFHPKRTLLGEKSFLKQVKAENILRKGLVAQLNSASDYGSEGCRFESCRGHLKQKVHYASNGFLF